MKLENINIEGHKARLKEDVQDAFDKGKLASGDVERLNAWLTKARTHKDLLRAGETLIELIDEAKKNNDLDEGLGVACSMCGGELGVLGTLGKRTHYQCRNCGAMFS